METHTATSPFLEVRDLVKEYPSPDGSRLTALRLDGFSADRGEAVALEGPSGSGKTTLLYLLAALTRPTKGKVRPGATDTDVLFEKGEADRWRARSVGYVFQNMNLLPDFSALENILIAAEISGMPATDARKRGNDLLSRLGLSDRAHHRPDSMSLGEQQRAAVARAVVHRPPLVLADEPTASLDAHNAGLVLDLLTELCSESGSLLILATHDGTVKERFRRSGRIVSLCRAGVSLNGAEDASS